MTGTLKALGLASLALLAISALTASLASANEPGDFTTGSSHTTIEEKQGGGQHTIRLGGLGLICTTDSFHGTAGLSQQTLKITPSYSNCHEEIFELNTTVTMNGCDYVFNRPTSASTPAGHTWTGSFTIDCTPNSNEIIVHASTCTLTIPEQSVGGLTYTVNTTGTDDIQIDVNSTSIHYTEDDGFLCPLDGPATNTDGTYTGTSTFEGTNWLFQEGESVNFSID